VSTGELKLREHLVLLRTVRFEKKDLEMKREESLAGRGDEDCGPAGKVGGNTQRIRKKVLIYEKKPRDENHGSRERLPSLESK